MRILITGASGLLGINLALEASALETPGLKVYGVVNQQRLRSQAFEENGLCLIQADLLEPGALERVLDQTQPDWIIHCAALAIVDACEADPKLAQKLNSEVPARLAEWVASHVTRGGARLLHVSTDAVFDGEKGNYSEDDLPNPLSVYAQTKLEGEYRVMEADPNALVVRVNMIGWSLTGRRSLAEFFYNNFKVGKPMMGFIDVIFCPLLVNHLARLLLEMLAKDLNGLYHVVSSECISKHDFGLRLAQRFGFDESLIRPVSVSEGVLSAPRSSNLSLCTQKLTSAIGKKPPGINCGINELYSLHHQGYPQNLQKMLCTSVD